MADLPIKLWCGIEGQPIFGVFILPDHTIDELKEEIYNKKTHFLTKHGLDGSSLTIMKVRHIMIPMRTLMY